MVKSEPFSVVSSNSGSSSTSWTISTTDSTSLVTSSASNDWAKSANVQVTGTSSFRNQPLTNVKFETSTAPSTVNNANNQQNLKATVAVSSNANIQHSLSNLINAKQIVTNTAVQQSGSNNINNNNNAVNNSNSSGSLNFRLASSASTIGGQNVVIQHQTQQLKTVAQNNINNNNVHQNIRTVLTSQNSAQSITATAIKSTQLITSATILQPKTVNSSQSILLPTSQTTLKTVPVLQTSTARTSSTTSYQAPVLAFLNTTAITGLTTGESGPLLTNLLLKPAREINLDQGNNNSGVSTSETAVQYFVHQGRLQNVTYLPAQANFQIPISG